jgi:hypothetical protein
MELTYRFDCYRSVAEGWVATGTLEGLAGGSFEERPLWYGCQGATWEELQAGIGKLVEVLTPRVDPDPRTTPIEATVRAWPEGQPLLLPPVGNPARLFDNLVNVGTRRRAWVENADEVQIVSFLKIGALAITRPQGPWKPELVSSFLGFAISLVPEHPTPIPERAGQTSADLVEEILLGGREDD